MRLSHKGDTGVSAVLSPHARSFVSAARGYDKAALQRWEGLQDDVAAESTVPVDSWQLTVVDR